MKDTKTIKVLNYSKSPVIITGINRTYKVEAGSENRPASIMLSYDDIDHINSNTDVFRTGRLSFLPEEADEVHEMLGNIDIKDTCFTKERIRDIILNPTYDKALTVLGVTSISVMERFRAELLQIKRRGSEPVANNIDRVITERYREVNFGVRKSRINVTAGSFVKERTYVDDLEERVKALQERLAELESKAAEKVAAEEPQAAAAPTKPARKTPAKKTVAE